MVKGIMKLRNPKPNTAFRIYNGRLALFHRAESARAYWRDYWTERQKLRVKVVLDTGDLREFEEVFPRYIVDREKLILDAGCGAGFFLAAFTARAFSTQGVDYESNVVSWIHEAFPELSVEVGDVCRLKFDDESIGYYLSLGVVEHFEEGPERALREAYRVLRSDGYAFVSVPYLNDFRAKHRTEHVSNLDSNQENMRFHQYYYSIEDFREILRSCGFEVLECFPYGCGAFLHREFPFFSATRHLRRIRSFVQRRLLRRRERVPLAVRFKFGHMMLYVCRKAQ